MATLRTIARTEADTIREGIAWLIIWKTGRSWHAESVYLTVEDDTFEPGDLDWVRAVLADDPNAVMVNGYHCGHLGEDMTAEEIETGLRWHYENGCNRLEGSTAFPSNSTATKKKPLYHVASFSGGKDSTAMVLRLIELGEPLDEVVCCDTTVEFPAMYRHIEKVKQVVEEAGIKFTTLRAEHDFEYYLTEIDVPNRKEDSEHYGVPGYGWPSHRNRWCTRYLKTELIKNYFKEKNEHYEVIQYIGIAADEGYRLERKNNQDPNHRHPLVEWKWTETEAMQYCNNKGYDWEGLYDIFHRVSCWLCPLQTYDELRNLRKHFPDLWQELLRLDARQWQTFAHGYSIPDFDRRFALEDALTAEGESIKNKQFFADLKRLLAEEATIENIIKERKGERKL